MGGREREKEREREREREWWEEEEECRARDESSAERRARLETRSIGAGEARAPPQNSAGRQLWAQQHRMQTLHRGTNETPHSSQLFAFTCIYIPAHEARRRQVTCTRLASVT
jgi:hypothetical protein